MIELRISVNKPTGEVMWEGTYPTTHAANDMLGDRMGSQEYGMDDLSGLSLGEFRGRLVRLLRRLDPESIERALVASVIEDPFFPDNEDMGKKRTVVTVSIHE